MFVLTDYIFTLLNINMRNMKKIIALGFLILLITFSNKSMAQADAIQNNITIEDKLVEVTAICIDAIEAPTVYNEFVIPYISLPDFPKKTPSTTIDSLRKNIYTYLIQHPNLVDKIREERKKAHDKLYGSRQY